MRNVPENIGYLLRNRRELLGLLQPQLAAISGVSVRTIQLVEMGKGNPSLDTLIKLAEPLGLQIQLSIKEAGRNDSNQL